MAEEIKRRRADTEWRFNSGRDCDGNRFAMHVLFHASGRVLGKVYGPCCPDEILYRASFYCAVPKDILDTNETFDFIDGESARAFIDATLAQFDPLASPGEMKASARKAKEKEPAESA